MTGHVLGEHVKVEGLFDHVLCEPLAECSTGADLDLLKNVTNHKILLKVNRWGL